MMGGLSPDVIVFDTTLSLDDKRRFVGLFRSLGNRLKIIELKEHTASASEADVDAVLSKPFHARDLIAKIDIICAPR